MESGWRGQPVIQDAWEAGCLGNGDEQQNAHQNQLSTRGDFSVLIRVVFLIYSLGLLRYPISTIYPQWHFVPD